MSAHATTPEKYEVGHSGSRGGISFKTLKNARKCAIDLLDEGKKLIIIRKFTGRILRDNVYGFGIPEYVSFERPVVSKNGKVTFKRHSPGVRKT
jgi:hypothetical protein